MSPTIATLCLIPRPLPDISWKNPYSCEIKFGSGLQMRLNQCEVGKSKKQHVKGEWTHSLYYHSQKLLLQKKNNFMLHTCQCKWCLFSWRVELWSASCQITVLWKHLFEEFTLGHKPPKNGQDCRRQERNDKSSHLICFDSRRYKIDVNKTGWNHNGCEEDHHQQLHEATVTVASSVTRKLSNVSDQDSY